MRHTTRYVSLLFFADLISLGVLLINHVLSFFGVGLLGFIAWGVLTLVGAGIYFTAHDRQVELLYRDLYYEERHPLRLFDIRNARYTMIDYHAFWRYRATAKVTMPLAPKWLVRVPGIAFILAIPYFVLQLYLLMAYPATLNVILARLILPFLSPFFLYSLPILYSWRRELETNTPR